MGRARSADDLLYGPELDSEAAYGSEQREESKKLASMRPENKASLLFYKLIFDERSPESDPDKPLQIEDRAQFLLSPEKPFLLSKVTINKPGAHFAWAETVVKVDTEDLVTIETSLHWKNNAAAEESVFVSYKGPFLEEAHRHLIMEETPEAAQALYDRVDELLLKIAKADGNDWLL